MAESNKDEIATRLARLNSIPPQLATPDTVAEAQELATRLDSERGDPMWFDAQMLLGNHLLETPGGSRARNVAEAEAAYRRILECATPGSPHWCAGEFGLANALLRRPEAGIQEFGEASGIYEQLIAYASTTEDAESQAKFLGNAALLYGNATHGDQAAYLEKAIRLQERSLQPPLEAALTQATRARAQYNLAGLLLRRKAGVPSQNLDRAIRLLQLSLEGRPESEDPLGRVRTLRALAMAYPQWHGADLPGDAEDLAHSAEAEAQAIESRSAVMQHRARGWANVARQQSALNFEIPDVLSMPREAALQWLSASIENHLAVLDQIQRDSEPLSWADWQAGRGRLLALLPRLDIKDQIGAAYECFQEALKSVDPGKHTKLFCDITARFGELAHEVGDFETSWRVYAAAAEARDILLAPISEFEHRIAALSARRGYGLYAAYAAARLERNDEALQLAESERARVLDELIEGLQAAVGLPPDQREVIAALVRRIRESQAKLFELKARTPEGLTRMLQGALADFIGGPRGLLGMGQIKMPEGMVQASEAEIEAVQNELVAARGQLRRLSDGSVNSFDAEKISALAQSTGAAIVYILATTWGTEVVGVLPDGRSFALHAEELTTDQTVRLVHGGDGQRSFADAISSADPEVLADYLQTVVEVIGGLLILPFASWLREQGVERAVVIPAGSFSALPLQAIEQTDVAISFAPSARLLALSRERAGSLPEGPATILASPRRSDEVDLPWSVAECRYLQKLREGGETRSLLGGEATMAALRASTTGAGYVHIASHAQFRPADPLASRLLLADEDALSLQDVMQGTVDFSAARLLNLAGCQTGNAEYVDAPDEQLGFGSVMLSLGIPAVVSTRWNVDDAAAAIFSARLMELLFRDRLEPVAAVAAARSWLRRATGAQMKELVSRMQAALRPGDQDARVALAKLRSELAMSDPEEPTRFASITLWGAFMLTGL